MAKMKPDCQGCGNDDRIWKQDGIGCDGLWECACGVVTSVYGFKPEECPRCFGEESIKRANPMGFAETIDCPECNDEEKEPTE